jgi:hypothetical protein
VKCSASTALKVLPGFVGERGHRTGKILGLYTLDVKYLRLQHSKDAFWQNDGLALLRQRVDMPVSPRNAVQTPNLSARAYKKTLSRDL